MERADGFPFLDPAVPHRAVGVRAATEQGVITAAVEEQGDPETINLDGMPSPLLQFFLAADLDKLGQAPLLIMVTVRRRSDLI